MRRKKFSDWSLIFDFDGTLAKTTMIGVERINNICQEIELDKNKTPDNNTLRRLWGLPYRTLIEIVANEFGWSDSEFENFWIEDSLYINPKPKKFNSIDHALSYIHEIGFNLGIISSRDRGSIIELATTCGIDLNLFDYLQGSHCHDFMKPDPRVFDLFEDHLKQKGRDVNKVIYVGDTVLADYEAAKRKGLKFVAIASSFISTPADFMSAGLSEKLIFDNPADLCLNIDEVIDFYQK